MFQKAIAGLVLSGVLLAAPATKGAKPKMTVWKTATCGCCGKWVEYMRANGFDVVVDVVTSTAEARRMAGIPDSLGSCHTATVGGYGVEGHVPVEEVKRLLREKPKAKGIAVPQMPIGSPGMEAGSRKDAYAVLLVKDGGETSVYQKYPGN